MNPNSMFHRTKSRGSALLVAVIFLLLAGLMTLLALNVGVFETRSTSNDVRARLVNEAAEAGLSQAFEYLLRQQTSMMDVENASLWEPCLATDTTYPCGAISTDAYDHDADASTPAVTRRESMFRLVATGYTNDNFDGAMVRHMLDLPNPITKMGPGASTGGGFDVTYGVAPVACFVAPRKIGEAKTNPIRCATNIAQASNRRIVTFVSVAAMPGESARTTLTQTVGRFALVDDPMGKPPLVASGGADVTGGLQIVTNPNSAGPGVPVSVWTRKDVTKTGTPNTCYADEFFRFGAQNSNPPSFFGTVNKTIVCDTCSCNGDKSLSYDKSGIIQAEGIDILDVDVGAHQGVNYDVGMTYPNCEFPPDLFGYVFGQETWEDDDHDCFGERKLLEDYTNPNNGTVVKMGADEAYLYSNAETIVNPTTQGSPLVSQDQAWTGGYPSTSLGGLVWCQSDCDVGPGETVGSPDNPVVLVIDGGAAPGTAVRIQGRVFGLVFVRTVYLDISGDGATLTPATPAFVLSSAQIAAGGTAVIDMNAGAAIYGALVIQGKVDKANGSASVIYDGTVLGGIGDNPNGNRYATLPGAWTDSRSY